jgi:serine/threonine protein phosphatase 1
VKRTVIIGDIHGCWDELQALLDAVAPAHHDTIIAIGDLVDRGPDSEKVLALFRDTPNAVSLMGNHERKHVRSARGQTRAALSQRIVKAQLGEHYIQWVAFMETFPRHLDLPEATLVHGFFAPGVPLDQQRDNVVIGTLSGEAFMQGACAAPWYDHYDGPKPLVFGHHDYLRTGQPVVRKGRVHGLDTGCAHGGRLTALVLPEFRLVSVPARADYWAQARMDYAVLAGSGRKDPDLDWEILAAFARSASMATLPAEKRERAARCALLWTECQRLMPAILAEASRIVARTLDGLAGAPDWDACSDRAKAGRYAREVGNHRARHLLFAARKGELTSESLQELCPTPRALQQAATALGLAVSDS